LGELLRLFGYDVSVAYSAEQAISRIEACVPDVVLTDINIPVVNGFQLARQIRRRCGARMRLVAHTAYPRSSVAAQAEEDSIRLSRSRRNPWSLRLPLGGVHERPSFGQRLFAIGDNQSVFLLLRVGPLTRAHDLPPDLGRAKAGAEGDNSPVPVRVPLPQSDKRKVGTRALPR
jgi:CheY-like chemotaxis protein